MTSEKQSQDPKSDKVDSKQNSKPESQDTAEVDGVMFSDLGLPDLLLQAVNDQGYERLAIANQVSLNH